MVRDAQSLEAWKNGGGQEIRSWLAVPLFGPSGSPIGALCVLDRRARLWNQDDAEALTDVAGLAAEEVRRLEYAAELHAAEALIERQESTIRAFFNTAPLMMGITEVLADDVIHHLDNSATADFFGTTPEAMAGKRATALGADATTIGRWLAAYDAAIRSGEPAHFDYVQGTEAGPRILSVSVSHIGRAPSGHPLCSYTAADVTEERDAKQALERSEQGLQLALSAGRMGAWQVDLVSGETILSQAVYGMYGLSEEVHTLTDAFDLVHAMDRDRVIDEFKTAIDAATATGNRQDVLTQYRVRVGDQLRWFRTAGCIYSGHGGATAMAGTVVDVTAEIEHEASLVEAREQAKAATREAEAMARLRQSILHNMSHEIRTPLTAVIGYADLLIDEACDADAELAGCIQSASLQLLATLNSVLDHARLEANLGGNDTGVPIGAKPLDAASAATSAAALFTHRAHDNGIALTCTTPEAPCWTLADPAALQRVLANLISNAVKFTDAGSVDVSVHHDPNGALAAEGDVVFRIEDTGIGMSPDFLAAAFQPFRQESTGHARSHEGTGLGLAIVRRLVELMGGTVRVESERGSGTTFEVRLASRAHAVSM